MKATHPSLRDWCNYGVKSNEVKNTETEINFMSGIREDSRGNNVK